MSIGCGFWWPSISFQSRTHAYSSLIWNALEYLSLFLIVLTHEFGHQLACRSVGGQTHDIVLWFLRRRGVCFATATAGAQLWSIAAGPLVNVALDSCLFRAGVGEFASRLE